VQQSVGFKHKSSVGTGFRRIEKVSDSTQTKNRWERGEERRTAAKPAGCVYVQKNRGTVKPFLEHVEGREARKNKFVALHHSQSRAAFEHKGEIKNQKLRRKISSTGGTIVRGVASKEIKQSAVGDVKARRHRETERSQKAPESLPVRRKRRVNAQEKRGPARRNATETG